MGTEKHICSRRGCQMVAQKFMCSGTKYCHRHYRIFSMRKEAKKNGKSVPTWEQLESMFNENPNIICHHCGKEMVMHCDLGRLKDVVTLQHRIDGGVELLCYSCNSAHANIAALNRDDFYSIPKGHKRCPMCEESKPLSNFSGRTAYCRPCNAEKSRSYRKSNTEKMKAYEKRRLRNQPQSN